MAKLDLSDYILMQRMDVAISKEAFNKNSIDDVIKSLKPGSTWNLSNYHNSGPEVMLSFVNEAHEPTLSNAPGL